MMRKALAVALVWLLPVLGAADDDKNPAIEYRQSLMTLVGANFGPISAMVEGKIPWDDARVAGYGEDLQAVVRLDVLRGFPEGSEGGKAKPAIWRDMADFREKLETMQTEAARLGEVARDGDRGTIAAQLEKTGKTCKACHDDYKEKD